MTEPLTTSPALVPLTVRGDDRGSLIAIEGGRDIPFEIARVYYIFDTAPGVVRGLHAHYTLDQWLVCVNGHCIVTLDDGHIRRDVLMSQANVALPVGHMIWHEMRDFAPGTVLMVLASEHYREADYIRDYNAFLSAIRTR